jgi:hypothetical protein
MKKSTKIFSGIVAIAVVLTTGGAVFAGTADVQAFGAGYGRGTGDGEDGLLTTYMESAIAEGLGLTVEELDVLLAEGETHYTIALDQGLTVDEITAILENAQDVAIEMALSDGIVINRFGLGNESSGRFGTVLMDPESCLDGTCVPQPVGTGIRRGARR